MLAFPGDAPSDSPPPPTDADTCELYLSLMCQFKRDQVMTFVQECDAIRRHKALEVRLV